ncbi:MAG TPA: VCBS repeat-containing protein [Chitinophagaceae bacterium]|nr:VCBS repeat-containing protein [Chitinophagaceae bacterium]
MTTRLNIALCFFSLLALLSCNADRKEAPLFEVLDNKRTGLDFSNKLTPAPDFNMFQYMYFYNGAGLGAGDFNNDGRIDLFFASNQGKNTLYLNTGNLQFKDVTDAAKVPQDGGWSTGVSVVDINNDGLLDIYVCRVGKYGKLNSKNQLLVCERIDQNGTPVYADKAKDYGLDFSGFSTQAAFLDYDMDGDLDMYLLNHSLRFNGTFAERKAYEGTADSLSGDKLYRNDGRIFTDVTAASGIISSVIGYGLGVCVADINLDGYPDMYIGNDFHENDYLYINQRNGTFKEELTARTMHISQFSMGVDVADVNNDAWPEIISMDMLPDDPYILKRSLGEDAYDVFHHKVRYGYHYQYARNTLQLNRGNGQFSEIGLFAGVGATDWSWAPLWVDFDNDGLKDLFVSNGIPKRLNDIDYVNYVSNEEIQYKIRMNQVEQKDMALIDKFPQIKLHNKFFRNAGGLQFRDQANAIASDKLTYSNGAVYADFDNDGDLDIAVNNIDEPALLYQNKSNDAGSRPFMEVKLKGPQNNVYATGARIMVFCNGGIRTYEKYPARGFQSSMEIPMHVGLEQVKVDSILLIWPDNTYEHIAWKSTEPKLVRSYRSGLPVFNYTALANRRPDMLKKAEDITTGTGLLFRHRENPFMEFDREPLIPRMVSREGPALATGDMNGDGLDDVFIGAARDEQSGLFLQQPSGKFVRSVQPALRKDSIYEDVDACWADVNKDGFTDLVVASGGNEFYGPDFHLLPRVYLNNGAHQLEKLEGAFDSLFITASCIVPHDFNGDGYVDLFLGGRAVPWEYGQTPRSYLLLNDKTGRFRDVTQAYAKDLSLAGFVTQASWTDIDKDGDKDLLLALEWDGICAFINDKGRFTKKMLSAQKGWWNFALPVDIDNDGDLDLIAGNLGLNSRLKATADEPVKLYYADFDNNGKREQVLTYYLHGREIPFATKAELEKQMPVLRKRFLYAEDFAKASLDELFGGEKLKGAIKVSADYFSNAVFINQGDLNFRVQALPWEAQLSSYRDAAVIDANGDNLPDILLGGNFYESNIQMGRYDADIGTVLVNKGNGSFACELLKGPVVKGEVRRIRKLMLGRDEAMVLARNNDSTIVLKMKK